jgi:hypothetical protein
MDACEERVMFKRVAALFVCIALSACTAQVKPAETSAPAPAPVAAVPETAPPPMTNGAYIFPDCEGEGGCPYRNWRAATAVKVLPAQDPTAAALATLTPGEWVVAEAVETRLIPVRGVARAGDPNLTAGEVVYRLEYEGEGVSTYWVRGARASLDEQAPVDWQEQAISPAVQATLGLWAKVKRTNGQTGWVRFEPPQMGEPNERLFECMGPLAGDEGCRE